MRQSGMGPKRSFGRIPGLFHPRVPILAEHCRITATKARRGVKHAPVCLQQLHCAVRLEPLRPGTIRPHVVPCLSRKFTKKRFFGFRVSNRRPASSIGGQVEPRPFLEISAQDQLRSKGTKKNSRTAVVNMRSAGGRVQEPPSPHLQFRYPHCVPILVPMVLDRSHNLRMVREGRTNVTILV